MVAKKKDDENSVDQETSTALVNDVDKRQSKIAELAYAKAETRGFASGHEMEDWLEAEKDIMNNPDQH